MKEQVIYEIFGEDAFSMTKALLKAARVEELIPEKSARIALKPNLILDDVAENGAVTHPEVVEGCIDYLKEKDFNQIEVIESSWVGASTQRSVIKSGIKDVCDRCGVGFFDLKKDDTILVETPFRPIKVCKRAYEADFLIDLPVLKGHCQTRMTCAVKNLKGCIPDSEKRQFHADGLTKPIAALATALKPDFVVVDSICGDLDFEEGGNPVRTNRMFAGRDALNTDAYACRLMGLLVSDVPYLTQAAKWQAGSISLEDTKIVALNEPEASAVYPKPNRRIAALTKKVHSDKACSACFSALVRALYEQGGEGLSSEIYIGQGYKGKELSGIGIGKCASGAGTCVPGCPPSAMDIVKVFNN